MRLFDDRKAQIQTRLEDATADAARPQRTKTRKRSNTRSSDSEPEYESGHASDVDSIDDGCFRSNTITGQGGRSVEVSQPAEFTPKVCKVTNPLPMEDITTEQIVLLEQGLKEVVCGGPIAVTNPSFVSVHEPTAFPNLARCPQKRYFRNKMDADSSRTT